MGETKVITTESFFTFLLESQEIKVLFDRLFTADDKARTM